MAAVRNYCYIYRFVTITNEKLELIHMFMSYQGNTSS